MIDTVKIVDELKEKNLSLDLNAVSHESFSAYGELVTGVDFSEALAWLEQESPVPDEGNCYVPGEPELEKLKLKEILEKSFWGGMECQIGYCNGRNTMLNGLEYHRCSELLVAGTDLVLFLGRRQDMRVGLIDSGDLKAFYLSKGDAVELFATTLHYVPARVSEAFFKTLIILPVGTNLPLERSTGGMLRSRNKWFIAHNDAHVQRARGAVVGITGENYELHL